MIIDADGNELDSNSDSAFAFWFMAWDHDRWEILCSFEFGDLVLIHTHIYPTVQKFEPTLD